MRIVIAVTPFTYDTHNYHHYGGGEGARLILSFILGNNHEFFCFVFLRSSFIRINKLTQPTIQCIVK